MVLMQPQVSGLVRGDELGGRGPFLGMGRDHGKHSCGSVSLDTQSLHCCTHCPSLQGRHSPNAGTPLALELCGTGEVSPVPGHAGLFLTKQGQCDVPCPGAEQGWHGIPHVPALVFHPPCPRGHMGPACVMQGWRGVPHVPNAIIAVTAGGLCRARRTSSSEPTSSQPTPDAATAVASWGSVWVWGQCLACAQQCPHTPLSSPCWPGHTAGVAVATARGA